MNKQDLIDDLREVQVLIQAAYNLTERDPVSNDIIEMAYKKLHPWINKLVMSDDTFDCCKKHWLHGGECE